MSWETFVLLLLVGVVWGGGYLLDCALHPYKRCGSCNRSGESRSPVSKRAFGTCRPCKGTGRHLRTGARLIGRS